MNKLSTAKRVQVLNMLVEGMSMRATSRVADVSINTVSKLMVEAGQACAAYHDEAVRGVEARKVQCDEIWAFCYAKERNVPLAKAAPQGAGDVRTWTALDSDSKMILSYEVGDRSGATAIEFTDDLRARLANRVQLTTDGHKAYLEAVEGAFGGDWTMPSSSNCTATRRSQKPVATARPRVSALASGASPRSPNGLRSALPMSSGIT